MAEKLPSAFELDGLSIATDKVLPTKKVITDELQSSAFRRIVSSIREVGLIEPLIVFRRGAGKTVTYSLLDGHLRLEAMKKLGHEMVPCLLATEEEAYTYNHKVNVVPPIHEHYMIMKAIESGVSEERIAKALSVDVSSIRQKRDLLNGICPEAVALLRDKHASRQAFREFHKVKPMRQIEIAELMINSHNFTASYAKCLLAATPDDQLAEPSKPKAPKGMKPEEMARMEREMEGLDQDFSALEEVHGKNVLNLVLATGYLRKLSENAAVMKYLGNRYPDILSEFKKLVETSSLSNA